MFYARKHAQPLNLNPKRELSQSWRLSCLSWWLSSANSRRGGKGRNTEIQKHQNTTAEIYLLSYQKTGNMLNAPQQTNTPNSPKSSLH